MASHVLNSITGGPVSEAYAATQRGSWVSTSKAKKKAAKQAARSKQHEAMPEAAAGPPNIRHGHHVHVAAVGEPAAMRREEECDDRCVNDCDGSVPAVAGVS